MKNNGRVCVCGSISEYDDKWAGQSQWNMILMRRLMVSGFICTDHMNEFAEASAELGQFVKEGRVKYREDIREGLHNYISTVKLLLSGSNDGKLILKL
jgi:NADPH-dependent curcumin reductase CurA